jgi:alkylation response protein AidB-like acyl-CoA dehydrogenase
MRFDLDDTQYALRDLARDLFTKESPPSRVRELWDGKPYDRSVWKTMAEAGIVGLTVPEEFGGMGGNEVDLLLVYEEAGRAALPEPLLETTGIAVPLLVEGGSEEQKQRWLPAIASGDAIVAVEDPGGQPTVWAEQADLVITADAAGEAMVAASLRGAFGTAAMLNGVSMQLIDRTVAYVKDRQQFGRPIGSFQAVKHMLASMHQAIETSRPATWYAAYALATSRPDALEAASVAKAAASDVEAQCNRDALQCHGGIGFTWEDDLHLWLKRGMTLRSAWGTAAEHRRLLVPTVMEDL